MDFMENKITSIVEEAYLASNKSREYCNELVIDKLLSELDPADVGDAMLIASDQLLEKEWYSD